MFTCLPQDQPCLIVTTGSTLSDCPEVVSRFCKDGLGTPSLLLLMFLWLSFFFVLFFKSEYKALLFSMEKL